MRLDTSPPSELERLYRAQRDRMWRAVFAFAGDREVASDAVAEAFTQVMRRGRAVRSPERWVWRAAFRIAAGELKRRRTESLELPDVAGRTDEMDELAVDLVAALATLSQKQRAAIVLRYIAGYPTTEIAGIIGSTGPGVHVHLSRARKRLRELLETDHA
jgi:RNA polymerase sigma-70 factor (ECF subfamily)